MFSSTQLRQNPLLVKEVRALMFWHMEQATKLTGIKRRSPWTEKESKRLVKLHERADLTLAKVIKVLDPY